MHHLAESCCGVRSAEITEGSGAYRRNHIGGSGLVSEYDHPHMPANVADGMQQLDVFLSAGMLASNNQVEGTLLNKREDRFVVNSPTDVQAFLPKDAGEHGIYVRATVHHEHGFPRERLG